MTIERASPGLYGFIGTFVAYSAVTAVLNGIHAGTLQDPAPNCATYRQADEDERTAYLRLKGTSVKAVLADKSSLATPEVLEDCIEDRVETCDFDAPVAPIVEQCLSETTAKTGG